MSQSGMSGVEPEHGHEPDHFRRTEASPLEKASLSVADILKKLGSMKVTDPHNEALAYELERLNSSPLQSNNLRRTLDRQSSWSFSSLDDTAAKKTEGVNFIPPSPPIVILPLIQSAPKDHKTVIHNGVGHGADSEMEKIERSEEPIGPLRSSR
eukprot:TRINITY_DN1694_c0_g1_i3.p1 TRINITY_DN1694_c0_g1~~TRINITY_DN1694_c0_g1_i3.p1  ORF type:complete len:154 (-),score=27.90 TRINITY_DN1694_c0_g1_i3:39-500(-)